MQDCDFRSQMIKYAEELRKPFEDRTGPMKYASAGPTLAARHSMCSIKFITECAYPEQGFVSFIAWAYAQR